MNGTEMTVNFGELLVKDNAEHFHFEATLVCRSGSHILGILAASTHQVELLVLRVLIKRRDDGSAAGLSVVEVSNRFEGFWVQKFSASIFASAYKHGVVICECQTIDLSSVDGLVVQNLTGLEIVVNNTSEVCCDDKALVAGSPNGSSEEVVLASLNFLDLLYVGASAHAIINSGKEVFKVVDTNVGALFMVVHTEEFLVAVSEAHLLGVQAGHAHLSH
jgi:hypothetical protein